MSSMFSPYVALFAPRSVELQQISGHFGNIFITNLSHDFRRGRAGRSRTVNEQGTRSHANINIGVFVRVGFR